MQKFISQQDSDMQCQINILAAQEQRGVGVLQRPSPSPNLVPNGSVWHCLDITWLTSTTCNKSGRAKSSVELGMSLRGGKWLF